MAMLYGKVKRLGMIATVNINKIISKHARRGWGVGVGYGPEP